MATLELRQSLWELIEIGLDLGCTQSDREKLLPWLRRLVTKGGLPLALVGPGAAELAAVVAVVAHDAGREVAVLSSPFKPLPTDGAELLVLVDPDGAGVSEPRSIIASGIGTVLVGARKYSGALPKCKITIPRAHRQELARAFRNRLVDRRAIFGE